MAPVQEITKSYLLTGSGFSVQAIYRARYEQEFMTTFGRELLSTTRRCTWLPTVRLHTAKLFASN